jgi:hypothetical protein
VLREYLLELGVEVSDLLAQLWASPISRHMTKLSPWSSIEHAR